ncbi:lycopene cyclase family protein [Allostreptomyces psammosilenae]|uniref:Lycopene beta-cyclase n=1 Tax=Allostreptomyces psammosilenae TaxID=1892865 RepID=A0A852ZMF4_9ACTN|nr:lycopene cyclase family protein [Allostreptomyces psammosilenae]NYI03593.1 lycopene beta-cyclase [Allostreptomyces psammosilenae]
MGRPIDGDTHVAVVGAGAAGLSLAAGLAGLPEGRRPRLTVLEAPAGRAGASPERTWCFWERAEGELDALLAARWDAVEVVDASGRAHGGPVAPLAYKMLRSRDHRRALDARLEAAGARCLQAWVREVADAPDGRSAVVRGRDAAGRAVRVVADWVFDSRPPAAPGAPPAGRAALVQHFTGWFVRTGRNAFVPSSARLMDLRVPQPARGVAFVYVLPLSPRAALVEYTEFTPSPLPPGDHRAALRRYAREVLRLPPFEVTGAERGAIPMTDLPFPRRAGRRVFRIGTAGGATRPSTGYTFSGARRQAAEVVAALVAGREPLPPVPYPRRHLWMDAALLHGLAAGRLDGADFFAGLFRRNPPERLLRFLDGGTSPAEELAVGLTVPTVPMLSTLGHLLAARMSGRIRRR